MNLYFAQKASKPKSGFHLVSLFDIKVTQNNRHHVGQRPSEEAIGKSLYKFTNIHCMKTHNDIMARIYCYQLVTY